ncbi:MAG: hypothetical protein IT555_03350 [Acetobacteraceae bacterium]|nr:hypothetical protein [Acetobacteraceae bacterium]
MSVAPANPLAELRAALVLSARAADEARPLGVQARDALILLILQQLDRLLAALERLFTAWQAGALAIPAPRPRALRPAPRSRAFSTPASERRAATPRTRGPSRRIPCSAPHPRARAASLARPARPPPPVPPSPPRSAGTRPGCAVPMARHRRISATRTAAHTRIYNVTIS